MSDKKKLVAEERNYGVITVAQAKEIVIEWLKEMELEKAVNMGLPEVDDRYHLWRIPLVHPASDERVGEVSIDARTSLIIEPKATAKEVLETRLLNRNGKKKKINHNNIEYKISSLRNTVGLGDSEKLLEEMPSESVDLVFTSPLTEYVLVYRKKTDLLIDWHIRNHPDKNIINESKIGDDYEKTNIWKIHPANHPVHPAVFPQELAEKVISYYSFKNDVVLDPFAGVGTVGKASSKLGRRFVLFEKNPEYMDIIRKEIPQWIGKSAEDILWLNCPPADTSLREKLKQIPIENFVE